MDLKLPHLGEGADSGTVVNLFVKEGDQVTKDQAILELENEKAVATIPATAAGKVTQVFVKAGDKVSVGQRILSLTESGDSGAAQPTKAKAEKKAAPSKSAEAEEDEEDGGDEGKPAAAEESEEEEEKGGDEQGKPAGNIAAAPSIRKMARDLG